MSPIWIIGGFLALILAVFLIAKYREKKRTEALTQLSVEIGFAFVGAGGETPHLRIGGRSRHDYRQTVAAFKFLAALPQFDLRPENFLHRIGSAFGYQDIDFDSNPEFSKRYLLRGDEEQVRRLFTPSLLMFFEQLEKGWSVETSGPWLMAYRLGKQLKPQADLFREFIERTSSIAAAVKSQGGWA